MASSNGSDHKGHRERLRKRFIENGLDGFEEHQALELFLFYAIPRKDTNPLAHRLLERYRSISGVCDAPIDELQRDFGISENAAALLKLLPEMSRLYNESRLAKDSIIDLDTLGEIVKKKFIGRTAEVVVLILGVSRAENRRACHPAQCPHCRDCAQSSQRQRAAVQIRLKHNQADCRYPAWCRRQSARPLYRRG